MAAVVTWWISTPKWVALVLVDDQDRIVKAEKAVAWALGQRWDALLRTLQVRYPGQVKTKRLD